MTLNYALGHVKAWKTGHLLGTPSTFPSIAILINGQVGQFWKAHPGHISKAPKEEAYG